MRISDWSSDVCSSDLTPEFQVGDEVYGYVRKDTVQDGTFAELVAAPVRTLARKPASLSFEEAAAVPLAGLTAYQAIQRSGVKEGQTDRKSDVWGKRVSVRVDLGGGRYIKKKKK